MADTGAAVMGSKACPVCGSPMVRAIARRPPYLGRRLWRCTDFECPGIVNIDGPTPPPGPRPGESAQARYEHDRALARQRIRDGAPFLFGVAGLASLLAFWVATIFVPLPYAFLAPMVVVALVLYLVGRMTPEVIDWKRGAEAERRVGESLDALTPLGFITLYDRSLIGRGGNIDAVTVGPPGIFVVESKWRRRPVEAINRRLEVGGREQPEIVRQVRDLAMAVQVSIAETANAHRLTVRPVICIGNRRVEKSSRVGGIPLVDANSIGRYMARLPSVLTVADIASIAQQLDHALPPFIRR
jgi:hypothetical protein